jgi:hypothetical protein
VTNILQPLSLPLKQVKAVLVWISPEDFHLFNHKIWATIFVSIIVILIREWLHVTASLHLYIKIIFIVQLKLEKHLYLIYKVIK